MSYLIRKGVRSYVYNSKYNEAIKIGNNITIEDKHEWN